MEGHNCHCGQKCKKEKETDKCCKEQKQQPQAESLEELMWKL